jgi:hypothetical protein
MKNRKHFFITFSEQSMGLDKEKGVFAIYRFDEDTSYEAVIKALDAVQEEEARVSWEEQEAKKRG